MENSGKPQSHKVRFAQQNNTWPNEIPFRFHDTLLVFDHLASRYTGSCIPAALATFVSRTFRVLSVQVLQTNFRLRGKNIWTAAKRPYETQNRSFGFRRIAELLGIWTKRGSSC